MTAVYKCVMIRHGETVWDVVDNFTGWFDTDLTPKGYAQADTAGKTLKAEGYTFDAAHTSLLRRAQATLTTILNEIGQPDLPTYKTWRLNEKHAGGLTGLSTPEVAARYGAPLLEMWQRCYDLVPPPMTQSQLYYSTIVNDPRYATEPKGEDLPFTESFKQTYERTLPYWLDVIAPQIKEGKQIIIAAHSYSLRGIIKHLDGFSDNEIVNLILPTGIPFVYELDEDLKPLKSMVFLGDEETVNKAMADVIAQEIAT